MQTDRYIFSLARFIIRKEGIAVPYKEWDAFHTIELYRIFPEYNIAIFWAKALVSDGHGNLHEVEKIEISLVDYTTEELLDYEQYEEEVVYTGTLSSEGIVDTFYYISEGTEHNWVKNLTALAEMVMPKV